MKDRSQSVVGDHLRTHGVKSLLADGDIGYHGVERRPEPFRQAQLAVGTCRETGRCRWDEAKQFHTNFRTRSEGETLGLTAFRMDRVQSFQRIINVRANRDTQDRDEIAFLAALVVLAN